MTKVINLFGGPGSGKSTTAAGLFFYMKLAGYKCELVREYAKELCYMGILEDCNQYHILRNQFDRQNELYNKVDYIITDSPLLLSIVYSEDPYTKEQIEIESQGYFDRFDNYNFFIERVKKYETYGRDQKEDEARKLDFKIKRMLIEQERCFIGYKGDYEAPREIMVNLGLAKFTND